MNNEIDSLGYLLNKASRLIRGKLNDQLKESDLTASQLALLKDLQIHEDLGLDILNFTPASIAERLNSDRPTVSGIIERLAKKNMILVKQNPKDRRSQLIELTKKSRELLPMLENSSKEAEISALKNLNAEEAETLKRLLRKVISNISE